MARALLLSSRGAVSPDGPPEVALAGAAHGPGIRARETFKEGRPTMTRLRNVKRWRVIPWAALFTSVALQTAALELDFVVEDATGMLGQAATTEASLFDANAEYSLTLTGTHDPTRPDVGLHFIATNHSLVPQTFLIRAIRLLSPASPGAMSASVAAGLVASEGREAGSGILSAAGSQPVVVARANAQEVAALFGDAYALDCAAGAVGTCSAVDSGAAGPNLLPAGVATESIALTYTFELMPGDTATGSGWLRLSASGALDPEVPEPSTGLLWAAGLLTLAQRARRHSGRQPGP